MYFTLCMSISLHYFSLSLFGRLHNRARVLLLYSSHLYLFYSYFEVLSYVDLNRRFFTDFRIVILVIIPSIKLATVSNSRYLMLVKLHQKIETYYALCFCLNIHRSSLFYV